MDEKAKPIVGRQDNARCHKVAPAARRNALTAAMMVARGRVICRKLHRGTRARNQVGDHLRSVQDRDLLGDVPGIQQPGRPPVGVAVPGAQVQQGDQQRQLVGGSAAAGVDNSEEGSSSNRWNEAAARLNRFPVQWTCTHADESVRAGFCHERRTAPRCRIAFTGRYGRRTGEPRRAARAGRPRISAPPPW